jgi:hypothetical protein
MITEELRNVRTEVNTEFDLFSITSRGHAEKGQRMLFLFQRDLMPGVNGQILEAKQRRDTARPNVRHASTKLAAWLFIISLCLAMLFYIMLFALEQTKDRQSAWFRSFMIWLVLEIFLTSTASVFVTHILIPMIAMRDVSKIKQKLLSTIRDHYSAMKRAGNTGETAGDKSAESFNAAEYLFVSFRLAKLFPELKESGIILRYSTAWPKQSYLHKVDVSKTYSHKFSAVTSAVTMILIFLVTNLLSIPPTFQDMIIHIVSTASIGYTVLLHVQLFHVYPVLVLVPTLLVGMVVHFLIKGGRSKAKAEIAKLMPVEEKARRQSIAVLADGGGPKGAAIVSLDSIKVKVGAVAGANEVGANGMAGGSVAVPGNSTFKSRRASLREGKAMMREIIQLDTHSELRARLHENSLGRSEEKKDEDDLTEANLSLPTGANVNSTSSWYAPLTVAQLRAFEESGGDDSDSDIDISSESNDDDDDISGDRDSEDDLYNNSAVGSSTNDSSEIDSLGRLDRPIRLVGTKRSAEASGHFITSILTRHQISLSSAMSSSDYSSASERYFKNASSRVPGAAAPLTGVVEIDGELEETTAGGLHQFRSNLLEALEARADTDDEQVISSEAVDMEATSPIVEAPVANVAMKSRVPKRLELLRSIQKQQNDK